MSKYLSWNSSYDTFNGLITNAQFMFTDLMEVLYFDQYDKLLYFCIIRNEDAFKFHYLGEEIQVGREVFCIIAQYQNLTKTTKVIGQKTGDRYFLYAFTTDSTKGYTLGYPMFFSRETNSFFTPMLNKTPDSVIDFKGCFTNRWEESNLLIDRTGDKEGLVTVEKIGIDYKIPIYEHAATIYQIKSNWYNRIEAITHWYAEGIVNHRQWDQGREVMWVENTESVRRVIVKW